MSDPMLDYENVHTDLAHRRSIGEWSRTVENAEAPSENAPAPTLTIKLGLKYWDARRTGRAKNCYG
jgi:hypothetical protein